MDILDLEIEKITEIKPIRGYSSLSEPKMTIDIEGIDIDFIIDECLKESEIDVFDKINISSFVAHHDISDFLSEIDEEEAIKYYGIIKAD